MSGIRKDPGGNSTQRRKRSFKLPGVFNAHFAGVVVPKECAPLGIACGALSAPKGRSAGTALKIFEENMSRNRRDFFTSARVLSPPKNPIRSRLADILA